MAEPFETLREVGVALDGFRKEVSGQFSTLKWIIGGVAAAGFAAAGLLYSKVDALEEASARNTAILERIEAAAMRSAANTDEIKDTIHAARAAPAADAFDGWLGVKASALGGG